MMGPYHFGTKSKRILATLHPEWHSILYSAIEVMDFTVISGFRGEEEQNDYHHDGLSQKMFPDSVHNHYPSLAVDLAPWKIAWKDSLRFARLAGIIDYCAAQDFHGVRWGGDWDRDYRSDDQTFMDLGHFELVLNERK
jgi:peptidoglycan L-alanyl-D-glutamate endopeptidase CwlK